ncbi:SDR family NAD(P)-dependent oxidoreductase [Paralimibaculum aggregatum]|uniref:SDR family NAD(P)-dependent oxidoreductase n=1 Tax=Paralimibaculum aggregatum TaxID=3036245 RepID=A0ABQ6LCV5_9RHOB|nr:SDR family NAD(P)-dependent oxidoreductase [Limibaculum sp. NKW23]GMG81196.1 SDR family NAD(P)-dependent oxidoreductase [Limibaculum sp. NKW23]
MADLSGQVALVTGASRGFGRAAALALAGAGAHVVALARTVGALEELDDAVQAAGGQATLVPLDIGDDAGLARMGAALFERWGRVDAWLHTAVYAPPLAPAEHVGEKELDTALAVNVRSFQRLIRVVDPLLRPAPAGRALIAADPAPVAPFHGLYCMTKAAQAALTAAWVAEVGSRIAVAELALPPMPTALRGRFHPGESREGLTDPGEVAARLLAKWSDIQPGEMLDLR